MTSPEITSSARSAWSGFRVALERWLQVIARVKPLGLAAGLIVIVFVLIAIFAPWVAISDPLKANFQATFQGLSLQHPLGTDELGRDVYSRIVYGARVSLQAGLVSVAVSLSLGACLGLLAGYVGGWIDQIVMWLIDAILAFPVLILALAITAALGSGLGNAILAIGIVYTPQFARLTRAQVLLVREFDYVQAARSIGAQPSRIVFVHIWPNVTGPLIIQASLSIAYAILAEASLGFLGLGVAPPTPSWGSMLKAGYNFMDRAPWLAIAPGAAIFIAVLSFNILGDVLRDTLDPRLRSRLD